MSTKAKKKIIKDVKSFVVDRKRWFRGQGDEKSRLLNQEGKMCCLGFYAKSCGLKQEEILEIPNPCEVDLPDNVRWDTKLVEKNSNSDLARAMIEINDSKSLSHDMREIALKALFAQMGVKVAFRG